MSIVSLTADNIDAVLDLDVRPERQWWVRPVSWYVARSPYDAWVPVAICVEGEVVGFADWAYDDSDASHSNGVVIDARQGPRQGRDVGALPAAAIRLRGHRPVGARGNPARALYRLLGFVETGERDEGELVMLRRPKV